MEIVNMHEAETGLSLSVDKAAKWEPFVIAGTGKPVSYITAADGPDPARQKRTGFLVDRFKLPVDLDRPGEAGTAG